MSIKISQSTFDAFSRGDHQVFEWIFTNYSLRIRATIRRFIGSDYDAEELTHIVFMKLWENRQKVLSHKSLIPYLYTLATNEACQFIKNKNNNHISTDEISQLFIPEQVSVETEYQAYELELRIKAVVDMMPDRQRQIFIMSRREGLSNSEIAQQLNLSKRTVEDYISISLKQIRKVIFLFLLIYAD